MRRAFLNASSLLVIAAGLPLLAPLRLSGQVPASSAAASAASTPAYESDPKFVAAMNEGKLLTRQHQYTFAVAAYMKANKIAGGACFACLEKAYQLQFGLKSYKDAVNTAEKMIALAKTPRDRSIAETDQGQALLQQGGDKPKPALLEAAHTALLAALTDFPKNNSARYADGCVLARMGKPEEASEQFSQCAKLAPPSDPMKIRAQHFAENPALSLAKMAPAFTVRALDGKEFTLDEMGGRVVLIDFWATWCGPCNEELPQMKKIAKEFAGQPLVIISISWDADETKWKQFIDKQEMTWVQYRDADHKLSDMFGVNAIPHYFTIDSDGVLTTEMVGSGSDVEGKLKKLLKRANDGRQVAQMASVQAP